MLDASVNPIINKLSGHYTSSSLNFPQKCKKPCSTIHLTKCWTKPLCSSDHGLNKVNAIFSNNLKLPKNMLNSTLRIFVRFSDAKPHQRMISTHCRNPCIHAPVWVFCVQLSHRVITLKK